jgi:hypothetical protein
LDRNPITGSFKNVMEKVENATGIDLSGGKHGEIQKVGNLKVGKGISADIVSQLEKALRVRSRFCFPASCLPNKWRSASSSTIAMCMHARHIVNQVQ